MTDQRRDHETLPPSNQNPQWSWLEADGQDHVKELVHLSRLVSLGELISGLHHELVQPLSAILNYCGACSMLLKDGRVDDARHIVASLNAQADLAFDIVEGFKQFVQKGSVEKRPVDLCELVQGTLKLIQWKAHDRGVSFEFEPSASLPAVQGDRNLIRQVIMNLLCNALDATDESSAPIVVTLQSDGDAVEMRVRDHGSGIAPDVKARLFESFFTTKPTGVGIGLSVSYRIIESHGGRLWGENNSNEQGATFGFRLPTGGAPP